MKIEPLQNWADCKRKLPPTHLVSEQYGRDAVAASYYGDNTSPAELPSTWQHGWIPQHARHAPEGLFGWHVSKAQPCYVARKDDEEYLKANGFSNARAIGLPIAYTEEQPVQRIQNSLLIMPAHTSSAAGILPNIQNQSYIDALQKISSSFSLVVACVSPACLRNGLWAQVFSDHGIEVIAGANFKDQNGLRRMRALLSAFDYITTNTFGSHLAYGAYFGAKVSIYGPFQNRYADSMYNEPYLREYPHLLKPVIEHGNEPKIREHFPELFVDHPHDALAREEWGGSQIGADHKVSPTELRHIYQQTIAQRTTQKLKNLSRFVPKKAKDLILNRKSEQEDELVKMRHYPRYEETTTKLLGSIWSVPDAYSFAYTYRSIFQNEVYRFVPKRDNPYIIDGGANVGLSVMYFKTKFPNCQVVAYEADPRIFGFLSHNCQASMLDGVELHNRALWTSETTLNFKQEGADAGCLTASGATSSISVKTVRLQKLLESNRKVDFLKLDVEGAEVELLLDCRDSLEHVDHLFVEYHSPASEPQRVDQIFSILAQAGFRVHVHSVTDCKHPFLYRPIVHGYDLLLEIFAFRDPRFRQK